MSRALRVDGQNMWHHVGDRGAHRQPIFLSDEDRRSLMALVACLESLYGVEVHAFSLMTNHFHLLVRSCFGHLSRAMQGMLSTYVRGFNARNGFSGPLFNSRFWSSPLETESHILAVSRYVHRNPLAIAGANLREYQWSSYAAYIGQQPSPEWLRTAPTLQSFDSDRRRYQLFVEETAPGDQVTLHRTRLRNSRWSIDEAYRAVTHVTGQPPKDLRVPTPGSHRCGRTLLIMLCCEFELLPTEILAGHFGLANRDSLRSTVARAKSRCRDDDNFRALYHAVLNHLAQST